MIVIENVGRGLATDLKFEASRPIPANAFGIEEATAKRGEIMRSGPLVEGIPTLGPGDSRRITWGQYGGLKKALGDESIEITCEFRDRRRKMRATTSRLEVRSFEGTDATSSEGARLIKEVSAIGKQLQELNQLLKRSTHDESIPNPRHMAVRRELAEVHAEQGEEAPRD